MKTETAIEHLVVWNVKLRPNESMKRDWVFPLVNETETEIRKRLKADGRIGDDTYFTRRNLTARQAISGDFQ